MAAYISTTTHHSKIKGAIKTKCLGTRQTNDVTPKDVTILTKLKHSKNHKFAIKNHQNKQVLITQARDWTRKIILTRNGKQSRMNMLIKYQNKLNRRLASS